MNRRTMVAGVALMVWWVVGSAACAPYLPPTTVPAVRSPTLESFRTALKTYVEQTQPFRKDAAVKGDAVPKQASADGSEEAIRLHQRSLAEAIQTKVRPAAQQGDVLSPAVADLIRRQLATAFAGPKADIIRDGLRDQNEGLKAESIALAINQVVTVPRVPPVLLETLPQLPQQVDFAFSGRTLILRDVDADVVVDFIRQAFPDAPLAGGVPAPARAAVGDRPDQHHFMVVELSGDQMFFEAITPHGRAIDGVLRRTAAAAARPLDSVTLAWQDGCRVATTSRVPRRRESP